MVGEGCGIMNLSYLKSRKGTSMVLFALLLSVIMGFGAIVIDFGRVSIEKSMLQNAIDSSILAAAPDLPDSVKATETANHFIELNGYKPSDILITFSDSNKRIDITATKKVNYTFAKFLGFESMTLTPGAAAESGSIGQAFNYALFSGSKNSTLTLNGSSQYIGGSSHTNKNFVANGSKITITGACEAMTSISVNGSQINIPKRLPDSSYVEMPDFSETIKLQAESAGEIFEGNKIFNGSSLSLDHSIYVNGNLTVNGSKFKGKGCVLVTGNITFNGSNLNESTGDSVCFYSKSGNITINGSNAVFDGIIYSPNGSITMNGSNQTVNGRVIGNTVNINGSNLNIISGNNDLESLPTKAARLVK